MAECNQCFKTSDGTIKLCYECLEAESTLNLEAAAKAYTACGNYQKRIKELEAENEKMKEVVKYAEAYTTAPPQVKGEIFRDMDKALIALKGGK